MKQVCFLLILSILFFSTSCNETQNNNQTTSEVSDNKLKDLQVGGVYILKNKNESYYLTKILVIDDFAVHLRTYEDTFKTKPIDVNTEKLKILIGHAPLDKNGFLIDNPELLKIEKVNESELEGYRMYMDAMSK